MARLAHLAASLLRVPPTAIDLTPPSLLLRAMREAPKKYGLAACKTSPLRTNLVRDSTNACGTCPLAFQMLPKSTNLLFTNYLISLQYGVVWPTKGFEAVQTYLRYIFSYFIPHFFLDRLTNWRFTKK
jgi:hypothetical protein